MRKQTLEEAVRSVLNEGKEIDLQTFISYLKKLDKLTGNSSFFNNAVKEIGYNTFQYQFDGYLYCVLKINDDGSVDDYQDELTVPSSGGNHFKSIDDWINQTTKILNFPV